jgi:hypothetical protein
VEFHIFTSSTPKEASSLEEILSNSDKGHYDWGNTRIAHEEKNCLPQ